MKCIVYVRDDGGLDIIRPAPEARHSNETDEEFAQRIAQSDIQVSLIGQVGTLRRRDAIKLGIAFREQPYFIVDESAIPANRSRRKLWRWNAIANKIE